MNKGTERRAMQGQETAGEGKNAWDVFVEWWSFKVSVVVRSWDFIPSPVGKYLKFKQGT